MLHADGQGHRHDLNLHREPSLRLAGCPFMRVCVCVCEHKVCKLRRALFSTLSVERKIEAARASLLASIQSSVAASPSSRLAALGQDCTWLQKQVSQGSLEYCIRLVQSPALCIHVHPTDFQASASRLGGQCWHFARNTSDVQGLGQSSSLRKKLHKNSRSGRSIELASSC